MIKGDCFREALFTALKIKGKVVHGSVFAPSINKRIFHAWVEKGNKVYDNTLPISEFEKSEYYRICEVEVDKKYTYEEASGLAIKTKHFGPYERS